MTPALFRDLAIVPALGLLPQAMDSPSARAMILAICLQESKLLARRQLAQGPARGFPQFERIGVAEVLRHPASALHAKQALRTLCYGYLLTREKATQIAACHAILEHHDILACIFARLALWRLPVPLPGPHESEKGWAQYLKIWAPGKPHPTTWAGNFAAAWDVIAPDVEEV